MQLEFTEKALHYTEFGTSVSILGGSLPIRIRSRSAFLLILVLLALFLRVQGLGHHGFSEDEARKALAVEHYRSGDFTANGEHPMLMKLLSMISIFIAEKWSGLVPSCSMSVEAALRFPSALAGSLTVLAIYLLGLEVLNPTCALIAAGLWCVDLNGIAISRIGKEDSLLTLFFVLGNFFLLRGKRFHFTDRDKALQSYMACGASFGAFFATKYFIPLVWFTLIYYDIFRFRQEPRWRLDASTLRKFYFTFVVAFLTFNPVVLSPSMWSYYWRFFTHKEVTHNGYFMLGQVFLNKAYYTFWGMPPYYYPMLIFVKTPLPLVIALAGGLVYTFRRIREDRFLFLGLYFTVWLFLLTLPGGKFTRYYVTLLPAIVLLQALGIYLLYSATKSFLEKRNFRPGSVAVVMGILCFCTIGWQLVNSWRMYPDYSFYVAAQGGGQSRWGYYFPQDEFYDAGLREGLEYIAGQAPKGASVICTTPAAFQYYMNRYGRSDLRFISMANNKFMYDPGTEYYLVAQSNYRAYLENEYILTFIHAELNPLFVSSVREISSVEIFLLAPRKPFVKAPYWQARHWPMQLKRLSQTYNRVIL